MGVAEDDVVDKEREEVGVGRDVTQPESLGLLARAFRQVACGYAHMYMYMYIYTRVLHVHSVHADQGALPH